MSVVAIVSYPEPGHLDPTIKIARQLEARGHKVLYLGIPDLEDYIRAQRFQYIPIFEDLCPKGFIDAQVKKGKATFEAVLAEAENAREIGNFDPSAEIRKIVRQLRPDLFIVDVLLPDLALILRQIGASTVLFNALLYNPWKEGNKKYEPLMGLPEMVLCPQVFDIERAGENGRRFYAEASIDLEKREPEFAWGRFDRRKPLIYCSLGSQVHLYKESRHFFQTVIDTLSQMPGWQALIALGERRLKVDDFHSIPPEVVVVNWCPQMEALKRTSIAITHGGLNTIKSCIFFGVPMIVFPTERDTPMNASRVVYHGIGVRGNIEKISTSYLRELINKVDRTASIRERVERMGKSFREAEKSNIGIRFIESILLRQVATKGSGSSDNRNM